MQAAWRKSWDVMEGSNLQRSVADWLVLPHGAEDRDVANYESQIPSNFIGKRFTSYHVLPGRRGETGTSK